MGVMKEKQAVRTKAGLRIEAIASYYLAKRAEG